MIYRLLADVVVGIHFAFVAFVIAGGILVLRWPRVALLHLPCAVWGVVVELAGLICPLTPLEQLLRLRGGRAGYEGGFVEHYILPILYPAALTRRWQLALGTIALVVNVLVYWLVWRTARRHQ